MTHIMVEDYDDVVLIWEALNMTRDHFDEGLRTRRAVKKKWPKLVPRNINRLLKVFDDSVGKRLPTFNEDDIQTFVQALELFQACCVESSKDNDVDESGRHFVWTVHEIRKLLAKLEA